MTGSRVQLLPTNVHKGYRQHPTAVRPYCDPFKYKLAIQGMLGITHIICQKNI